MREGTPNATGHCWAASTLCWKAAGLAGEKGKVFGCFPPSMLHCQSLEAEKLAHGFESEQVIKGFPQHSM